MKPTTKTSVMTSFQWIESYPSFHGETVRASVQDLKTILGKPICEQNDGNDKVNFEWEMETEEGEVFTVYDWKEYRVIDEDEIIEWHIGSHKAVTSAIAVNEIADKLNNL